MKYAVEQRLRMIELLLYQYGYVNRAVIMDCFGIGEAAATRDFSAYKKLKPNNMTYNSVDKAYCITQKFERMWA